MYSNFQLKESGKVAARHILGHQTGGIKPTFVWSSFGGLHLRSTGSYLSDSTAVKYISCGDKHICMFYEKDTGMLSKGCVISFHGKATISSLNVELNKKLNSGISMRTTVADL